MAASRTKPHIEPTTTPTTIARMMPARQTYKQADISQVCIYLTHTTQKKQIFLRPLRFDRCIAYISCVCWILSLRSLRKLIAYSFCFVRVICVKKYVTVLRCVRCSGRKLISRAFERQSHSQMQKFGTKYLLNMLANFDKIARHTILYAKLKYSFVVLLVNATARGQWFE